MRHKLKFFDQAGEKPIGISRYLDFAEREPKGESKILITTRNGTTVRAVLRVCWTEIADLQEKMPSNYNLAAMADIEMAILSLEKREKDRKARGVEGYHLP